MNTRTGNILSLGIGALACIATYVALMALESSTKADHGAAAGIGLVLGLVCAAMTKVATTSGRQPRTPSDTGYGMGDEGPFIDFDGSPVGARNGD